MSRAERCDIIVVGGGSAAFEAAIAARQAGAEHVVMLEKATPDDFGGNARYSHTGFRCVYNSPSDIRAIIPDVDSNVFERFHLPGYSTQMFLDDLNTVTRHRIDQALALYLVEESYPALLWMKETGMLFEPERHAPIDGRHYFQPGIIVHTVGGGLGQVMRWRDIALETWNVDLRYDSRVVAFHGDHRSISGVRVSSSSEDYDLFSKCVIVCAGGFQASAEMRARYLGPNSDLMKVRGSIHDTGEVLMSLLALGAKSAGHWQGCHATPIDASARDGGIPMRDDGHGNSANRYDYMYGITVNGLAQRFYDEGESKLSYTYAKTGREVLAQPGGVAFQIFDKTSFSLFRLGPEYTDSYLQAPTIRELASKLGLQPEALEHTVAEFNSACRPDIAFDPRILDGKCTQGITPVKSNWAVPLTTPPFRAYPIACGVTFSFGGLQINTNSEVLNTAGVPIHGLYASGDIVGLFFHNYPSCTGQVRNAVFSRTAGYRAAAHLN